jgi:hypothetical protein
LGIRHCLGSSEMNTPVLLAARVVGRQALRRAVVEPDRPQTDIKS